VVLVAGGALRLGAVADLVSKAGDDRLSFGLGLTISIAQVPSIFGVPAGDGNFFPQLWDLLGHLDDITAATFAVGGASLAVLLLGHRLLPRIPATLLGLALGVAASSRAGVTPDVPASPTVSAAVDGGRAVSPPAR
jgi:MFS superfamily sulfate permease-like transporter